MQFKNKINNRKNKFWCIEIYRKLTLNKKKINLLFKFFLFYIIAVIIVKF
jgi:hypothetical protein